jgi:hypothetical protein
MKLSPHAKMNLNERGFSFVIEKAKKSDACKEVFMGIMSSGKYTEFVLVYPKYKLNVEDVQKSYVDLFKLLDKDFKIAKTKISTKLDDSKDYVCIKININKKYTQTIESLSIITSLVKIGICFNGDKDILSFIERIVKKQTKIKENIEDATFDECFVEPREEDLFDHLLKIYKLFKDNKLKLTPTSSEVYIGIEGIMTSIRILEAKTPQQLVDFYSNQDSDPDWPERAKEAKEICINNKINYEEFLLSVIKHIY